MTYWWLIILGATLLYFGWNLTQLKKRMLEGHRRRELALAAGESWYWDWSVKTGSVKRSASFYQILGYKNKSAVDIPLWETGLIHPKDRPRIQKVAAKFLEGLTDSLFVEYRVLDPSGEWRWVLDRGTAAAVDENNRPTSVVGITLDISVQKSAALRFKKLSYTDTVTGLYNRAFFNKSLEELDREDTLPLSIIIGDLNGLKLANDTFGHKAGDDLLNKMAEILKAVCRKDDIITRWGGDEFAIILPNTTEDEAHKICERIRRACHEASASPVQLSIALGAAARISMHESVGKIVRAAETSMYTRKMMDSEHTTSSLIVSMEEVLMNKYQDGLERGLRQERLAVHLGKALGLPEEDLREIALLARLHDIGHITTPEEVWSKGPHLTSEEEEVVRHHVETGARIAKSLPQVRPIAQHILAHHEYWDGSGYPKGLKGEDIPLKARIIAIVDAYDDARRGFLVGRPLSSDEALQEIAKHAGTKFDPKLVALFEQLIKS